MPGELHEQRSLAGYSPQVHSESDTTERLTLSLEVHSSVHQKNPWALHKAVLMAKVYYREKIYDKIDKRQRQAESGESPAQDFKVPSLQ